MKKRLLSVVLALAMILSTMSVLAFAADTSLAALIANAADGATVDWTGGDVTIADTITINKSITIDLNGAKIRSAKAPILDDESSDHFGKAIFNITGGDVEIINGYILGEYTKIDVDAVNTETVLNYATVIANLKSADAAIQVNGGNLTLNCTVVVGGMMYAERVYSLVNEITGLTDTKDLGIPVGPAVTASSGSLEIISSLLVGRWGVYDTNATVTADDALLIGYFGWGAYKNNVAAANGSTEISLYDLAISNIGEEGSDIDFILNFGVERASNVAVAFVNDVAEDVVTVEYNDGVITATVDESNVKSASELGTTSLSKRFSYTWEPEYLTVKDENNAVVVNNQLFNDGQYAVDLGNGTYSVDVRYRMVYSLGDFEKNILATGFSKLADNDDKAEAFLNKVPVVVSQTVDVFDRVVDKAMSASVIKEFIAFFVKNYEGFRVMTALAQDNANVIPGNTEGKTYYDVFYNLAKTDEYYNQLVSLVDIAEAICGDFSDVDDAFLADLMSRGYSQARAAQVRYAIDNNQVALFANQVVQSYVQATGNTNPMDALTYLLGETKIVNMSDDDAYDLFVNSIYGSGEGQIAELVALVDAVDGMSFDELVDYVVAQLDDTDADSAISIINTLNDEIQVLGSFISNSRTGSIESMLGMTNASTINDAVIKAADAADTAISAINEILGKTKVQMILSDPDKYVDSAKEIFNKAFAVLEARVDLDAGTVDLVSQVITKEITVSDGELSFTVVGKAGDTITTPDSDDVKSDSIDADSGYVYRATANGTRFLFWVNQNVSGGFSNNYNDSYVTADETVAFRYGTSTTLTAIFADDTTDVVVFNEWGRLIFIGSNDEFASYTAPEYAGFTAGDLTPGYDTMGATVSDVAIYTQNYTVNTVASEANTNYVVTLSSGIVAYYTDYEDGELVTVGDPVSGSVSVAAGTLLALYSEAKTDSDVWTANGVNIGDAFVLGLQVYGNVTVALRNGPATEVSVSFDAASVNGLAEFTFARELPAGYTVIEAGMLIVQGNVTDIDFDTEGVIKSVSKGTSNTGVYVVTVTTSNGVAYSAVPYIVYNDGTGANTVIYSSLTKSITASL